MRATTSFVLVRAHGEYVVFGFSRTLAFWSAAGGNAGAANNEGGVTAKSTNHGAGHLREGHPWPERHDTEQQSPAR